MLARCRKAPPASRQTRGPLPPSEAGRDDGNADVASSRWPAGLLIFAARDAQGGCVQSSSQRGLSDGVQGAGRPGAGKGEAVDVTLIDRNNYHLFQPLLYQVATAGLSSGDIAFPIRVLFRDNHAIRVLRGTVTGVDAARRTVTIDGREIGYDHLVLATGATHGYFGHEEWSADAPGLKHVEDAITIRARVLSAFERAEAASDPAERTRLLTFVICGAGPAGVELAGAIADDQIKALKKEIRQTGNLPDKLVLFAKLWCVFRVLWVRRGLGEHAK